MTEIKPGDPNKDKGVYRKWKDTAIISCPECGKHGILDHKIEKDGSVHPSPICLRCNYRTFIKLVNWEKA